MPETNEISELEEDIRYILRQIRQNQSQSCDTLRRVSDTYLRVLLGRALTRLSDLRRRELESQQD